MKCGNYEGDYATADSRLSEINNRCKDKRIKYDGEEYALVHCTGCLPVCTVYGFFDFDVVQ